MIFNNANENIVRVFISYTHDSKDHVENVVNLAQRLRKDGIDCQIDAFINGHPEEGWQLWMEREIREAKYVLLVCTENYYLRFLGKEIKNKGLGAIWEAHLTRDQLYAAQGRNSKFIPIIFDKGRMEHIPDILRYRTNHYKIVDDYEKLLRVLSQQPAILPHPIGPIPQLPPEADMLIKENERFDDQFAQSIRTHMAELHQKVEQLTKEQFQVIRNMRGHRRVRITGCAGSGKTLIAAEKAIRLSEAGLSTLCLCENPLLMDLLRDLTKGSGVKVESFTSWVNELARNKIQIYDGPWTQYLEPTTKIVEDAFDIISKQGPYYDAIIVDEGQDFKDEWWSIVEASLIDPNIGIFYIFHDDHQALLPYRASYPIKEPAIDLSRNCRNAGQIYNIMRCMRSDMPDPEPDLKSLGQVIFRPYDIGEEVQEIQKCLQWLFGNDIGETPVVLLGSLVSFETSPFAVERIAISEKPAWRYEVIRKFERATCLYDNRGVMMPPGGWDEISEQLKKLSYQPTPSDGDISRVQSVARLFKIHRTVRRKVQDNPNFYNAMKWGVYGNKLRLSRSYRAPLWASEIIMHFERNDWHIGIPAPKTIKFVKHHDLQDDDSIPVYQISDFKGLEADAVIFYSRGKSPIADQELYVGVSRARFLLALLIDKPTIPFLPKGVKEIINLAEKL